MNVEEQQWFWLVKFRTQGVLEHQIGDQFDVSLPSELMIKPLFSKRTYSMMISNRSNNPAKPYLEN